MAELDESLIRRAQMGDSDAFAAIITAYQQQIYGLSYRFFNNYHDAEDAAQETIIKIYRSLASYQGAGSFKSWIFTITANTCRDLLRKRKGRETVSYDDDEFGGGWEPVSQCREEQPEDYALDQQGQEVLRAAIARLPENFRVAIVMREFAQMNYEEISIATNTSLGTVKSRINRGRKMLREMIKQSREQEDDGIRHIG